VQVINKKQNQTDFAGWIKKHLATYVFVGGQTNPSGFFKPVDNKESNPYICLEKNARNQTQPNHHSRNRIWIHGTMKKIYRGKCMDYPVHHKILLLPLPPPMEKIWPLAGCRRTPHIHSPANY
jgi:hypothetical protein